MIILITCSIVLYVSRWRVIQPAYGKALLNEGIVFLIANAIQAVIFLWLAFTDPEDHVLGDLKRDHLLAYTVCLLLFFIFTEFLPLIMLGITIKKFQLLLHGEQN